MEIVHSQVFGDILKADDNARKIVETLVKVFPLDAFQVINRDILNPKGYMLSLSKVEEI